jgi:hypothetical protein
MKTDEQIWIESQISSMNVRRLEGQSKEYCYKLGYRYGYKASQSNIESEKEVEAIKFQDWIDASGCYNAGKTWCNEAGKPIANSNKELYQIFLKESRNDHI